jgi:hypothetical protein
MRRLLLLLALLVIPAPAAAVTYYVHPTGTNPACSTVASQGAGNLLQRKSTIAAGIACLASGDTLVIGAGTYVAIIPPDTIPNGTGPGGEAREATWPGATVIRAETPCTNVGAASGPYATPSCSTIIRPTSALCSGNADDVVWITNNSQARYIIFRGFEIDANSQCVQIGRFYTQNSIAAPDHIRVQDVYWHDALAAASGAGLVAVHPSSTTSTYMEFLDSTFKNFNLAGSFPTGGGKHCLYFGGSGTIRRNVIAQCSPTDHNGIGITTHNAASLDLDISGNDIWGWGFGGVAAAGVTNSEIYNNIIHDGGTTTSYCSSGCGAILVNSCGGGGGASPVNTLIANNTVYGSLNFTGQSSGIVFLCSGSTGTTIQNNIMFGGTNDTISGSDSGTISNNRCASGCTTVDNPQFVNAAGGDFHLTISSPTAITQGGVNQSARYTTDKDGVAWGSTYSLGAYKFPVPSSAPAAPTNLRFTP